MNIRVLLFSISLIAVHVCNGEWVMVNRLNIHIQNLKQFSKKNENFKNVGESKPFKYFVADVEDGLTISAAFNPSVYKNNLMLVVDIKNDSGTHDFQGSFFTIVDSNDWSFGKTFHSKNYEPGLAYQALMSGPLLEELIELLKQKKLI